ncbi:MAG: ERAP1-like C-terminal domain-containing protein, partial [Gammaproteobacteria bacterium]|nr:ERAP1-like C-terminal domain-containing protein [Gammaproteobacteria bacterium]
CLRYGDEHDSFEACQLTGPAPTQVVLRTCPVWLLPNADYAGYFYWSVADYRPLLAAEAQLSPAEQLAVAHSIHAGLQAGRIDIAGAAGLYRQLATSQRPQVALTPRPFIEFSRQYLVDETSAIDAYVQQLYGDVGAALAFDGSHMASLSSDSRRLFLVDAARLLAAAGDQSVRRAALAAAAELVESNEAAVVAPEAGELALQIAAQVGGQALRQQLLGQLRESRDGQQRRDLLRGLAHADEPGFAASMRDLVLTDVIRVNEIRVFLREHVKSRHNRDATWRWLRQNYDALVARLPPRDAGRLPAELVAGFCDERRLKEVSGFLGPRLSQQVGGVRNLAKAIERIELCARRAAVQRPQARAYFSGG